MKIKGADQLARKMAKLRQLLGPSLDRALAANVEDIARVAKILVPRASGASADAITTRKVDEGYEMDFGPLSKVIEGGRKEGTAKSGRKHGSARAQPFVNPALSATSRRRRARNRRAASAVIKEAMRGG